MIFQVDSRRYACRMSYLATDVNKILHNDASFAPVTGGCYGYRPPGASVPHVCTALP